MPLTDPKTTMRRMRRRINIDQQDVILLPRPPCLVFTTHLQNAPLHTTEKLDLTVSRLNPINRNQHIGRLVVINTTRTQP